MTDCETLEELNEQTEPEGAAAGAAASLSAVRVAGAAIAAECSTTGGARLREEASVKGVGVR